MANLLIMAIIGGLIGWVASLIMKTDRDMGPAANILVGVAGAFLAGLVLQRNALVGELDLVSLLAALAGAIALIAVVNLIRKGRLR